MSELPKVRRADKQMTDEAARDLLLRGYSGRLGTVGPDGFPYVVPLLYVVLDDQIWVHNTRARGHLRTNVDFEARVCFEVDEPGEVFAYGRFECDSSVAYSSAIAFGRIAVIAEPAAKQRFCEALMARYAPDNGERPAGFFPRLAQITVYAITVERLTGKETPLPAAERRWPAMDMTKTPNAVAPGP
jgi:nitroimidazol reductase NimA-like FMN-containing flavoprotein (pyridoxamine 5'-phosphate oxidase superfamily)